VRDGAEVSLRRPTASQERSGKKKSACFVRNDGCSMIPARGRGETVGKLWAGRDFLLDGLLRFRDDVGQESGREQSCRERKRHFESGPATAATRRGRGLSDANGRWGDHLPRGHELYADRRPDAQPARKGRTGRGRRAQDGRGAGGYAAAETSCSFVRRRGGRKLETRKQKLEWEAEEERFLSSQADHFAGAKWEEKIGLLRSK